MTQGAEEGELEWLRSTPDEPMRLRHWRAIEAEQLVRALANNSRPSESMDKLLRLAQLTGQAYQGINFAEDWKTDTAANPITPILATFFAAALGRFAESLASADPKKFSTVAPRLFIEAFGVTFSRSRPWSEADEELAEAAFWEGLKSNGETSPRPDGATKADVHAGMVRAFKELYTERYLLDGGYVSSEHSKQMREVKRLIRRRLPWVGEFIETEG